MIARVIRFGFSLDGIFASKAHSLKEKERAKEPASFETKSVFSKDRRSKKFTLTDVKIPDINPVKSEHFIYDKNTIAVPRQVYIPPMKKSMRIRLQNKEYYKFKDEQLNEQTVETIIDEVWDNKPPVRYYEKATAKDLFYNYRSPKFLEYIARKNQYLPQVNLLNGEIKQLIAGIRAESEEQIQRTHSPYYFMEDHYKKLSEQFNRLKEAIEKASYKEIPQIAMSLQFDLLYKKDIYKIWEHMEDVATKHIYHYTVDELITLKIGLASTFPKACDHKLHNLIQQLIIEDYDKLTVTQLVNALYAFRHLNHSKIATKIIDSLIAKLPEYQNNHKLLADVFYTIANNYPKKHIRDKPQDVNVEPNYRLTVMKAFAEPLKLGQYDMDSVTKILLSIMLMRVPNFNDLTFIIENQITVADEFQAVHILYALSKINNGLPYGQISTYKTLEQQVWKYWDQYENLEKSRIYFAMSQQSIGNDARYISWIEENMLKFNHSELQNVVYGLMFNQINKKSIWMAFLQNIGYQREIIPIANYFCFKQAKIFMHQYYPDWNYKPFDDAATQAEYMLNVTRLHRQYLDPEQVDFQIELNTILPYDWRPFFGWFNTYYLQIVLSEFRIAVILQTQSMTINGKPKPQLLLQQQLMATQDWKLLIMNQKELSDMTSKKRAEYFKKTIDGAIEEQRGKFKTWEAARREEIYSQLVETAERTLTPGKRIITDEDTKDLSRKPV